MYASQVISLPEARSEVDEMGPRGPPEEAAEAGGAAPAGGNKSDPLLKKS